MGRSKGRKPRHSGARSQSCSSVGLNSSSSSLKDNKTRIWEGFIRDYGESLVGDLTLGVIAGIAFTICATRDIGRDVGPAGGIFSQFADWFFDGLTQLDPVLPIITVVVACAILATHVPRERHGFLKRYFFRPLLRFTADALFLAVGALLVVGFAWLYKDVSHSKTNLQATKSSGEDIAAALGYFLLCIFFLLPIREIAEGVYDHEFFGVDLRQTTRYYKLLPIIGVSCSAVFLSILVLTALHWALLAKIATVLVIAITAGIAAKVAPRVVSP
ncbi:hypothetical protein [Trinickia mobilis]|uniref:hypothetical protein n=1 Tax=Trinickia mobilis TaxID=2816356 RepID=UPI001A8DEB2E|nr:hypothetical protein [Trinickia mobilis]